MRCARSRRRRQKAVETAAKTFRQNPDLDTAEAIKELKLGEALVSFLENKGEPSMVQRALICPPQAPHRAADRRGAARLHRVQPRVRQVRGPPGARLGHARCSTRTQAQGGRRRPQAGGGGWWGTIFAGGKNPRTGRHNQGMGEMIMKDMQRTASRTAATMIKNIILKSLGIKR